MNFGLDFVLDLSPVKGNYGMVMVYTPLPDACYSVTTLERCPPTSPKSNFAESHFAESNFAESHFADSHFAKSHFAEFRLYGGWVN